MVNHILTRSDEFEKPQEAKAALELLGEGTHGVSIYNHIPINFPHPQGLIFAEGERHRKQVSSASLGKNTTFDSSTSLEASNYGMFEYSKPLP